MSEREERNRRVIDEFHANGGKVGGPFEGRDMIILHSKGAKSGQPRVTPLVYMREGDRYLIIASMGGAPTNPAWYHNLVANPDATVEVGTETFPVKATILKGAERDRAFDAVVQKMSFFGDYQKKTTRVIPVIALERVR